ncbi:hypothetical protein QUC31_002708 [Theobroma cacao]
MTKPTGTTQEEFSAEEEEQQESSEEVDSLQVAQGARERSAGQINETYVTQSEKGDDGDNVKIQGGGDQHPMGQSETESCDETEGSKRDDVKGQGGDDQDQGGAGASRFLLIGQKRGRAGDPTHVASSSELKPRKKGELELPGCPPMCYVCQKTFPTWRGVFGHLRSHNRQTPGAFPPPTFTPVGSPEGKNGDNPLTHELAPMMLNLARETLGKMHQDHLSRSATVSAGGASSSMRIFGMDLSESRNRTTPFLFDLNEPAPEEEDDADDGKN